MTSLQRFSIHKGSGNSMPTGVNNEATKRIGALRQLLRCKEQQGGKEQNFHKSPHGTIPVPISCIVVPSLDTSKLSGFNLIK